MTTDANQHLSDRLNNTFFSTSSRACRGTLKEYLQGLVVPPQARDDVERENGVRKTQLLNSPKPSDQFPVTKMSRKFVVLRFTH